MDNITASLDPGSLRAANAGRIRFKELLGKQMLKRSTGEISDTADYALDQAINLTTDAKGERERRGLRYLQACQDTQDVIDAFEPESLKITMMTHDQTVGDAVQT